MIPTIPKDWKIVSIGDITVDHKQGFYTAENYSDNGVKLVRITDLLNPKISYSTMPLINISKDIFQQFRVDVGDFLIARSGAIGRYGIVTKDIPCVFASYIIRFKFDSNKVDNNYIGLLFESTEIKRQLFQFTQGATNKNINAENIKKIKILLPVNIPEQKAIASIFSTVDDALQKSNELITKTEKLKKGLMQEFFENAKWRLESLSNEEYFKLIMGQSPSSNSYNLNKEGLPFYQGNADFGELYPKARIYCNSPIKIAEKGDILISIRAPVGELNIVDQKCCIGRGLAAIRVLEKENLFYFYFLKYIKNTIQAFSQGSTFKAITVTEFKRIKVPIPVIKEQQKIVGIFSTVDKKLEIERKRKEKFETIKRGLMNDLLTGKKRIKIAR